jgi:CRP-like cAMP-binding protein
MREGAVSSGDSSKLVKFKDKAARFMVKGAWNDALQALLQAQELAPKDTYIARKIGDMLQRMGKKREAILAYKRAAGLFAAAGFLFKAISVNKIILSIQPDDNEVQETLAELYSKKRVQEGYPEAPKKIVPIEIPVMESPIGLVITGTEYAGTVPTPKPVEKKEPEVRAAEPVSALSIEVVKVDAETLPWTPLFSELDRTELNQVIDKMQPVFAAEGTVICVEGDPADSLFVISSGVVRISSRDDRGNPLWLTNLGEGEFFGEFGFFADGKRHAEVVAAQDTELLQIGRDELAEIVAEFPRVQEILHRFYQERVLDTILAKNPLFRSLKPEQRQELIGQAALEVHEPGSFIIQEGDDGNHLFVIKSGSVEVYTSLKDERIDLATLGPGEIVGEISLLTGSPTTANVVARTRTELVKFSRREVVRLAEKHPQVAHLLSETKEHRVHETVQRIQMEGFV